MKKILSFLFLFIIAGFCCGCTEEKTKPLIQEITARDKLIVGVKADSKPFGFKDSNGNFQGFDIDLAKEIAYQLLGNREKIEFVPVTPSNRIATLTSGKVDMIVATMSITEQRKSVVSFSMPYYNAGQAVMIPANSNINGISDLNGKKVIVVLGSTAEKNIKYFAPHSIIQGYKTATEAYQALKKGKGAALTTDDAILVGIAMDDKTMKVLPKKYTQEPYAIAFRADKESLSLKNNVNRILTQLNQNGFLNKQKKKWVKI